MCRLLIDHSSGVRRQLAPGTAPSLAMPAAVDTERSGS